ncbi:MAG: hypothetical protein ACXWT0_00205 [Methylobacter sp.]
MTKNSWLGKLSGSGAEAKQRAAEDAAQRRAEGQRKGSIILNQKDVQTGNWDASKTLFTTIGGRVRPITSDDLAAFRRNIDTAQSQTGRFSKGITAKQVIDWSDGIIDSITHSLSGKEKSLDLKRTSDLYKARTEITMAVPVSAHNSSDKQGAKVRFITNAGPNSKVTRHHVLVEFMNYGPEANAGNTTPRKSAMRLRNGSIRIECDCERWRYFFRYLATIGGYNAGRPESGYPKIRNPKLQGIACKHIVRVMSEVRTGSATLAFLTRLMDKAKSSEEVKAALRQKQADAEKLIKNQAKRTTGNDIKTSEQKRNEREAKAIANAAKQAKPIMQSSGGTRRSKTLAGLVAGYKAEGVTRKLLELMDKNGMLKPPKGITKQQLFDAFGD